MIWFGWVGFYGISTIVDYLLTNHLNIKYIRFGLVLWQINHCWLFNAKSYLYIYIKYIYDLVWFYGISTIVSYLMLNPFYTYVLNGRNDLLTGRHYSVSVLQNHHDGSVEPKRYSVDPLINHSFHLDRCYQFFYILSDYNPLFTLHMY